MLSITKTHTGDHTLPLASDEPVRSANTQTTRLKSNVISVVSVLCRSQ